MAGATAMWFFTVCLALADPNVMGYDPVCYVGIFDDERGCDYSLLDDENENVDMDLDYYVEDNCQEADE